MITLLIDSTEIEQFQSITVSRSLDALCGQFEVSLLPTLGSISSYKPGSKVEISYEKHLVLTGYIDTVSLTLGSEEKSFIIRGRDITSILVDSSAINNPMGFGEINLYDLAKKLCDPFGIKVESPVETGAFHRYWYIAYGESIYENLDRMAKLEGVILSTSPTGTLIINKPTLNSKAIWIKEGLNLYRIDSILDQRPLYHEYRMTNFAQGLNNRVTNIVKPLVDESVKLKKTLIVDAEGCSTDLAKARLQYELGMRKARSIQISVEVPGWSNPGETNPFRLCAVASLDVDSLNLAGNYLVSGLKFKLDEKSGYSTEITLTIPEAYVADPAAQIRMNQMVDLLRKDQELK